MNKADKAMYEALWKTEDERLIQHIQFLHRLKLKLQGLNRIRCNDRNTNYAKYLRQCRDRKFNSIAGTVYCKRRNKYIEHFEYFHTLK